jgi:hypothetical protein
VHFISKQHFFHDSLSYEDIEIHCVEIAVLRKLGYFEVICNYFLLYGSTITFLGIFLTLSMTLIDRKWPEKSNGIGFRAIGRTMYTRE